MKKHYFSLLLLLSLALNGAAQESVDKREINKQVWELASQKMKLERNIAKLLEEQRLADHEDITKAEEEACIIVFIIVLTLIFIEKSS